jgi:hypothetical protein
MGKIRMSEMIAKGSETEKGKGIETEQWKGIRKENEIEKETGIRVETGAEIEKLDGTAVDNREAEVEAEIVILIVDVPGTLLNRNCVKFTEGK